MVKVDVGSQSGQAQSAVSTASNRIGALNSAITALTTFIEASGLEGSAYTNAKAYASNVLIPLAQALSLYSESVAQNSSQLVSLYGSYCQGENLDSDLLEQEISRLESALHAARKNYFLLVEDDTHKWDVSGLLNHIEYLEHRLSKVREKLRNLYSFNNASAHTFSDIGSLEVALMTGLNQVGSDFTAFRGGQSFPTYNKSQLGWVRTVEGTVEKRYQNVLRKVENGQALTEEDIKVIDRYRQFNPNVGVEKELEEAKLTYLKNQYQSVVDKYHSGNRLTDEDIEIFHRYSATQPARNLDMNMFWSISFYPLHDLSDGIGDIKKNHWVQRLLILNKFYPGSFIKKLLKSEDIMDIINTSKHREQIYQALLKYERMGNAVKLNSVGKALDKVNKATSWLTTPIRTISDKFLKATPLYKGLKKGEWLGKSVKILGKVGTVLTYADLAITGISSGANEFSKTGHVGKAVASGLIDTIKSIGPIEGATIGASLGAMAGTVIPIPLVGNVAGATVGAAVGLILGGVITVAQLVNPDLFSDIKQGAHDFIDKVDTTNKMIRKGMQMIGHKIWESIGDLGKTIVSASFP